jgi:hypothetical protein
MDRYESCHVIHDFRKRMRMEGTDPQPPHPATKTPLTGSPVLRADQLSGMVIKLQAARSHH